MEVCATKKFFRRRQKNHQNLKNAGGLKKNGRKLLMFK